MFFWERIPQFIVFMKVSIIIPTYKRSSRLPIAIDSVLNQTYKNIEIIVVDDNGDNEYRKKTKSVLEKFISQNKITYIEHQTNQGGCEARNTGAFAAKGNYIAFLDDDDFYESTKIEEQVKFLETHPKYDACMCHMYRTDDKGKQIPSRENMARGTTLKAAILNGNLFTSMLLIKKEVFEKLGGFSEISRFQDKYFHYKFLENEYQIGILDKQLLTLVEHYDIRISLTSAKKIINALDTLHEVELKHKNCFNNKEWHFIMQRFYYNKAYTLSQGKFIDRLLALGYIVKSLPYYNGKFKCFKLFLKALTPKYFLKLNQNRK